MQMGSLNFGEFEETRPAVSEMNNMTKDGFSVLIIDDDTWFQRVTEKYLKSWGMAFKSFSDPIDGVACAAKEQPQLILLDIMMPELNGSIALRLLKKMSQTINIPVIIVSSFMSTDVLVEFYQNGAAGFLCKPVTEEVLMSKIREVFKTSVTKKIDGYSQDFDE